MKMENKNENVKNENVKNETRKTITYKGVYLGSEWAEGVASKTGKAYAFGKITIDFKAHKRDGSEFKQRVEAMISSKDELPDESIQEYAPVLVEYELPESPGGMLRFVRIVENIQSL